MTDDVATKMDAIRRRLKTLFEGVKQTDVCRLTGAHPSQISRWLSGKYALPLDWLMQVMGLYQVNPNWLLFGRGAMKQGKDCGMSNADCGLQIADFRSADDGPLDRFRRFVGQLGPADVVARKLGVRDSKLARCLLDVAEWDFELLRRLRIRYGLDLNWLTSGGVRLAREVESIRDMANDFAAAVNARIDQLDASSDQ